MTAIAALIQLTDRDTVKTELSDWMLAGDQTDAVYPRYLGSLVDLRCVVVTYT